MKTVDKRLTTLVWYATALSLSSAFAWKSRIKVLRKINPAGAGYLSFDPTRPANSLTGIATGDVLTLDATGIDTADPATFFQVDNGEQPTPRPAPDYMEFTVPAGPPQQISYAALRVGQPVLIQSAQFPTPLTFSINGGPFVDDFTASQQIEALPASTYGSGPGYTIEPRAVTTAPTANDATYTFTLQQYSL